MRRNKRQAISTRSLDGERLYPSCFERDVCEAVRDWIQPRDRVNAKRVRIPYTISADYVPDIVLPNGIHVEVKGYFPLADRRKIEAVIRCNPDLDLRMVFSDPWTRQGNMVAPIAWCEKRGVTWAAYAVPREWLEL